MEGKIKIFEMNRKTILFTLLSTFCFKVYTFSEELARPLDWILNNHSRCVNKILK